MPRAEITDVCAPVPEDMVPSQWMFAPSTDSAMIRSNAS